MKNFPIIVAASTLVVIILGVLLLSKNGSSSGGHLPSPAEYEFYWGESCIHCKNVEDFLSSWDKKDKLSLPRFEVQNNRDNANKLIQRGRDCKLSQDSIGSVPLLVTPEGKCLLGDTPIIEYFKLLNL